MCYISTNVTSGSGARTYISTTLVALEMVANFHACRFLCLLFLAMFIDQWFIELFIIVIVAVATYVYLNREIYLLSWSLPGPFALPLVGNAFTFFCKDEDLFERSIQLTSEYSSPMRLWFGPKFVVIITDVIQAEKIISSMKFAVKDEVYRFIKEFNGEGLISGSGPKWKRDRRLISPLLLKKNMSQYFHFILHHTKVMINILDKKVDGPTFNIEHLIHRCAADFVNETIIGVKTNAQNGEFEIFIKYITRMYTIVHARIVKAWLQVGWLFRLTHYWREQEEGKRVIHGFFQQVINKAKENHACLGQQNGSFRSLLDQLLDIRDEIPDFATDQELIHHLCTLYSASEDTVTTIASFALVLLGMYPSTQNRVIDEIVSVMGKEKRDIEEVDLTRFEYLDMVIKDILRLFPIAPFIARESSQDYQLDKWLIPRGCTVIVSIHNIHRDKRHWEKPNEFYPEHFLPETVRKRHPYAFMPFSAGPRGCLGKPYSYMALKIILVTILQNFEIESDGKLEDKRLKTDISVRFKDQCYPVRIRRRILK